MLSNAAYLLLVEMQTDTGFVPDLSTRSRGAKTPIRLLIVFLAFVPERMTCGVVRSTDKETIAIKYLRHFLPLSKFEI